MNGIIVFPDDVSHAIVTRSSDRKRVEIVRDWIGAKVVEPYREPEASPSPGNSRFPSRPASSAERLSLGLVSMGGTQTTPKQG